MKTGSKYFPQQKKFIRSFKTVDLNFLIIIFAKNKKEKLFYQTSLIPGTAGMTN
jgi:hypothetical protein